MEDLRKKYISNYTYNITINYHYPITNKEHKMEKFNYEKEKNAKHRNH